MDKKTSNFKTIGIVGLGLIGGSIGLKLQKYNHIVYGLANNEENKRKALERKLANLSFYKDKKLGGASVKIFWDIIDLKSNV